MILKLHSFWAYLVIILILGALLTAIKGKMGKEDFTPTNRKVALFALIATHIQLLLGIALFVTYSIPKIQNAGMKAIMGNKLLRLQVVEHPTVMLITVILITIGFSKHKKAETSAAKFKTIALFYGIGLILLLSRIPWAQWM